MQILVNATEQQKAEWLQKPIPESAEIIFIHTGIPDFRTYEADCYFHLAYRENETISAPAGKLVFVNAVAETLQDLPAFCVRINAWNGFLKRAALELAASEANKAAAAVIMDSLQWKYFFVPDIAGMIAARTVCMIINEAYYALGENVSTKNDIDIAMKLGTNYPYGPFEWAALAGLTNVYHLLQKMGEADSRCTIAPLLEKELLNTIN